MFGGTKNPYKFYILVNALTTITLKFEHLLPGSVRGENMYVSATKLVWSNVTLRCCRLCRTMANVNFAIPVEASSPSIANSFGQAQQARS